MIDHRVSGATQDTMELTQILTSPLSKPNHQEQLRFISSLPNLHFSDTCHHSYSRNLSVIVEKSHLPISIRNRILYFLMNNEPTSLSKELQQLISPSVNKSVTQSVSSKKRMFKCRTETASVPNLIRDMDTSVAPDVDNMAIHDTSLFDCYVHQQLSIGSVIWRFHSCNKDVILMNSYDLDTGYIQPTKFVHIDIENQSIVTCKCPASRMITNLSQGTTAGLCCMHSRLVKQFLLPNYSQLSTNTPPLQNIVNVLFNAFKLPKPQVVQIGSTSAGILKFSVRGSDSTYEFVHLTDNGSNIACQSGRCTILMGLTSRKKCRKLLTIDQRQNLCPHLEIMLECAEQWSMHASDADEIEEIPDSIFTEVN